MPSEFSCSWWILFLPPGRAKKTLHEISNLTKEELIEKSKNAYELSQKYSWEILFAKYKKMYDEV